MIDILGAVLSGCMSVFQLPISFGDFDFSLWQVFLATALFGIIGRLIWGMMQ